MRDDSIRSVLVNNQQPEIIFLAFDNTTKQHRFGRDTAKGGWNKLDITWRFDPFSIEKKKTFLIFALKCYFQF